MYTKEDLINDFKKLGINPKDTLLVHSSMKEIGEVEGGADTVLDALMEYMQPGLLILPTHSWMEINEEHCIFDPKTEPSCVGILTNLFLKRPGVIRSWHPTHSVAAIGQDAQEYVKGEELTDTPCARQGCYGKLYDRKAKILFIGCGFTKNTFLHGVEEWNKIPGRLRDNCQQQKILTPDGQLLERPSYSHIEQDVSKNYGKMKAPFLHSGCAVKGWVGDAESFLCDAVGMADMTSRMLKRNPDLFWDDEAVPFSWYSKDVRD